MQVVLCGTTLVECVTTGCVGRMGECDCDVITAIQYKRVTHRVGVY